MPTVAISMPDSLREAMQAVANKETNGNVSELVREMFKDKQLRMHLIGRKDCAGCDNLQVFEDGKTLFSEGCESCSRSYPDMYVEK